MPDAPLADPRARAASPGTGAKPERRAALVPELSVADLDASLRFWCGVLGFAIAYDRPAARFAFLTRGDLQIMLCQHNGRWTTGALEPPLGRGLNLEMTVPAIAPLLDALRAAAWPIFDGPDEAPNLAWYRTGTSESGRREFLVQDPDGYLLRFAESLAPRA